MTRELTEAQTLGPQLLALLTAEIQGEAQESVCLTLLGFECVGQRMCDEPEPHCEVSAG